MSNQPQISVLNPHPKRLPGPSLLHELVSRSRDNAKTAVDFLADDGTRCQLSFERLHGLAEVLSDEILTRCHVREDRPGGVPFVIPVLVPQSTELYVAILGILKSGAAYCPIGLDSPRERVLFILGDVEAKVVVTTAAFKELFDGQGGISVIIVEDVLSRETSASRVAAFSAGLAGRAAPEDLAYIMYTSGSTGQPKGVGVSHGAVTQSLLAHDRHIPPFSRFLQFAAPTFDVSVFEIFFPLFRGVTLVATSRARLLNNLPEVLRSLEVDACELTPTVAGSLLRSRKNAPGLRLLLTIGEMLTPPVIAEFGGTPTTESILWAMYGPTEATIHW